MEELIEKIKNDKTLLLVVVCTSSEERKIIYQYLEKEYPKLNKTGFYSKLWPASIYATIKKCNFCNKGVMLSYSFGCMENNRDEYWSGECKSCEERIIFEPNYDDHDGIRRLRENNVIVIGNYITINKPNHAKPCSEITRQDFDEVMSNKKVYMIQAPNNGNKSVRILGKNQISKYIDEIIEKGQFLSKIDM